MLHIEKQKKREKWPQINQVLINSERKLKCAVSRNKEKPTIIIDNQSIIVIYKDTAFKFKDSKSPIN